MMCLVTWEKKAAYITAREVAPAVVMNGQRLFLSLICIKKSKKSKRCFLPRAATSLYRLIVLWWVCWMLIELIRLKSIVLIGTLT